MPTRAVVESILTEGYAVALALDAACMRLEQRIARITKSLAEGREARNGELPTLLSRLRDAESEVTELRETLEPLRRLVARAA